MLFLTRPRTEESGPQYSSKESGFLKGVVETHEAKIKAQTNKEKTHSRGETSQEENHITIHREREIKRVIWVYHSKDSQPLHVFRAESNHTVLQPLLSK